MLVSRTQSEVRLLHMHRQYEYLRQFLLYLGYLTSLGYPVYFLTLLGVWKILGVIAVLSPKFPIVKEWAYAGFFFAMSGAIISHLAVGDGAKDLFGPSLLLVLTITSWYFRPDNRKAVLVTNQ